MVCNEIQSWTFSGLVGAFLDLGIVFLLLCASTITYMVSKFLGLLGSSLPCHCNVNFGHTNSVKCWQRVLVNRPAEKISSVQFSVVSKLPFGIKLDQNLKHQSNISQFNENNQEHGYSGLDAEASSRLCKESEMEESAHAIRRRRKEGRNIPDSFGDANLQYARYSSIDMYLEGRECSDLDSNGSMDGNKSADEVVLPAVDLKLDAQRARSCRFDENNAIRVLEQALEKENTARADLCNELEKERSAAASAADEAMAMILRLQEEKASIEMEARQYRRMMEEKAAYDFEEMNILKEILLRREREKHFLEKEVEMYTQIIFENEQLDADAKDAGTSLTKRASLLLYPGEDQVLMLKSIGKSFHESEMVQNANKIGLQDCEVSFGKELSIPEFEEVDSLKQEYSPTDSSINNCHQHLSPGDAEMNLLLSEKSTFPLEREVKNVEMDSEFKFPEYKLREKTVACVGELQEQNDVINNTLDMLASKSLHTCYESPEMFVYTDDDLETNDTDENGMFNMDLDAHSVPTVNDKSNFGRKVGESESINLSENVPLRIQRRCDDPDMNRPQIEQVISRSCSDMTSGLPHLVCLHRKSSLSDFRRNSMPAVDYERFKIDNEIGWLRERLRIVQEGREKLKTSMEHGEKDKVQLQLLENIVNRPQYIRKLTETGMTRRQQVSLPPPNSKVTLKKKRYQSLSSDVHGRT